ncbi:hypothetical protein EVAR_25489_1 [Eumeta japonica]|uniref:Uncharacterized protein n=1 Tax=Eumeta variegata TaxID=151549 RepID=A0A4C1VPH9_EUMVA|nr:hypothetical protein EVAR_25489_1 [Eumeta japonica]
MIPSNKIIQFMQCILCSDRSRFSNGLGCPSKVRTDSKHPLETASGQISRPAPHLLLTNGRSRFDGLNSRLYPRLALESLGESSNHPSRRFGTAASALGEDINSIMSILQVVRSAKVVNLVAKFRTAKHGVDRLKIILENEELINKLEN